MRPNGAKAGTEGFCCGASGADVVDNPGGEGMTHGLCRCFCPSGAYRTKLRETQGVASLRSLALGWELLPLRGVR